MLKRLKILVNGQIVDRPGYDNCLACHNTTRTGHDTDRGPHVAEGVGCAACHGPDERWLDTHYRAASQPPASLQDGFVPARDLLARARMCATCHVGDRDRDMNHDLIAAGHPPLRYEFASYHAMQPKHWRDAGMCDSYHFESRLWLAGQLASLDASLCLLEARAEPVLEHRVPIWPEFSEFDCASCHHNLQADRRDPGFRPREAPSRKHHSTWNRAGLEWLLKLRAQQGTAGRDDRELAAALAAVRQAMEANDTPHVAEIARLARHARRALDNWQRGPSGGQEGLQFNARRLSDLVVSASRAPASLDNWESATQFYLAAVAGRAAWPGGRHGTVPPIAKGIQLRLSYPQGQRCPNFPFDALASPDPELAGQMSLAEALGNRLRDP